MEDKKPIVLTKPSDIRAFQLLALKGAMKLEMKGLKLSRGGSAFATVKRMYPQLTGSRKQIFIGYMNILRDMGLPLAEDMKDGEMKNGKEKVQ